MCSLSGGRTGGCSEGTDEQTNRGTHTRTHARMCADECMHGRKEGGTDGRTDQRIDVRADGQVDAGEWRKGGWGGQRDGCMPRHAPAGRKDGQRTDGRGKDWVWFSVPCMWFPVCRAWFPVACMSFLVSLAYGSLPLQGSGSRSVCPSVRRSVRLSLDPCIKRRTVFAVTVAGPRA